MAVNLNAVGLFPAGTAQTPTAPLIEGTAAATLIANAVPRFDMGSSLVGRYGMRVTYPAPLDFTGYDYISLQHFCSNYSPGTQIDTIENGGARVIFVDGSGNYAGFNIYGSGIPDYDPEKLQGFLASNSTSLVTFHISKARTPAISAGVIDWANIVAIECSMKTIAASRKDMSIYRPVKRNAPQMTGVETFNSFSKKTALLPSSATYEPFLFAVLPMFQQSVAQIAFSARIGLTIGDGVTATNLTDANFAVGFENPHEFSPAFRSTGPWILHGPDHVRAFNVLQSAADVLSLADGSFASAGWWQWELSGSGVATCTRVQYWRFDGFRAAHGHYVDCAWNDADSAVEVTAATVISGGLIRGAKATGLKVLGAAGVYSNLDLSIDSLVGAYDIELGAGGAGTYELPHITVPAGRTLRVRNNSASNAIVVILPPGTVYSATTAGGSITVVSAGTKLTITDLPLGCDAVVLTAGTSTVLAQADELPGATFVFEYTGAPVVDIGIFKPGYKPRYLRNLQLATSDSAIPVSLETDRSYLP